MPAWSTMSKPPASGPTGSPTQTTTLTTMDRVLNTLADAEEWTATRGMSLNLTPPEGDLVIRSLRYKGLPDVPAHAFVTVGLFTQETLKSIPDTKLMDIIPPEHPKVKVQRIALPPARAMESKLLAAEDLSYGQKILVERPSLLVPTALWIGSMDKDAVLSELFSRLSSESSSGQGSQLEKTKGLFTGKALTGSTEEKILRTNGISVVLPGESRSYSGIFVTLARCNHHCTPNSVIIWDPIGLIMSLFAVHSIKKGSEISIAYTDIQLDTEERLRLLQKTHFFKCVCDKACMSSKGTDRSKSDANRKKIREWVQDPHKLTFDSWLDLTKGLDVSKNPGNRFEVQLNGVLKALTDENLQSLRAPWMELTETLFLISLAKGDSGNKLDGKYKATLTAWKEYEGFDSQAIRSRRTLFEKWFQDPQSCEDWRRRT